jgi:chromosome segregation ATPase
MLQIIANPQAAQAQYDRIKAALDELATERAASVEETRKRQQDTAAEISAIHEKMVELDQRQAELARLDATIAAANSTKAAAEKASAELAEAARSHTEREAKISAREKEMADRLAQVDAELAQAKKSAEDAAALRAEWQDKIAKLKAITE